MNAPPMAISIHENKYSHTHSSEAHLYNSLDNLCVKLFINFV